MATPYNPNLEGSIFSVAVLEYGAVFSKKSLTALNPQASKEKSLTWFLTSFELFFLVPQSTIHGFFLMINFSATNLVSAPSSQLQYFLLGETANLSNGLFALIFSTKLAKSKKQYILSFNQDLSPNTN